MYQSQKRDHDHEGRPYEKGWAFFSSQYLVEIKDFDRIYARSHSAMRSCQIIA